MREGSINVKIAAYAVLYIVISVSRSGMPRPILAHKASGLDYQKGIPVGDLDCKDILCPASRLLFGSLFTGRENRQPYRSRQNKQ